MESRPQRDLSPCLFNTFSEHQLLEDLAPAALGSSLGLTKDEMKLFQTYFSLGSTRPKQGQRAYSLCFSGETYLL